jgi:hypothetical protein
MLQCINKFKGYIQMTAKNISATKGNKLALLKDENIYMQFECASLLSTMESIGNNRRKERLQ